jgi:hypothetical protein
MRLSSQSKKPPGSVIPNGSSAVRREGQQLTLNDERFCPDRFARGLVVVDELEVDENGIRSLGYGFVHAASCVLSLDTYQCPCLEPI